MSEHTLDHLQELQSLPLKLKVRLTQQRIREWVRKYGTDGVYVSFSGGKDSTVLLHLVREMYPDIPAVFCDTGLEYPEIREFVKTFDNVVWLKPKKNFRKVIEEYGYPMFSKEICETVYGAKRYLTALRERTEHLDRQTVANWHRIADIYNSDRRSNTQRELCGHVRNTQTGNRGGYKMPYAWEAHRMFGVMRGGAKANPRIRQIRTSCRRVRTSRGSARAFCIV